MVSALKERRPNISVVLLDSYEKTIPTSPYKAETKPIIATKENEVLNFTSLREAAKYFKVDRSVIKLRIRTGKYFNGWHFEIARRDMSKD